MRRRWWIPLALVLLLAVAIAPGLGRLPSAAAEYPPGIAGKGRALLDCVAIAYGAYRPRLARIRLGRDGLATLVPPVRVDQRQLAGMGECASIAVNDAGAVLVAWMMRDPRDGQSYKVYARALNRNGIPRGPDFRVNTGASATMLAHHVSARVDSGGRFAVLWHATRRPDRLVREGAGVFLRRLDGSGQPAGEELQISPELAGEMAEMALGDDDRIAVVWSDAGRLWGRILRADDTLGEPMRLDDAPAGALAEFPAAAFGPRGELLVAWADTRAGGRDVRARRFDRELRPLDASIAVGAGPVPEQFFRLIAVAATDSGWGVVWRRERRAFGRWIGASGRPLGAGEKALLTRGAEVAAAPLSSSELAVSNGRSLCRWRRGGADAEILLIRRPARPQEISLAPQGDSLWLAWHDAIDARPVPALGDNFYIMAARLRLTRDGSP